MPDTYSRRNEMCSQENLFCTTANKSRAESNSIRGNQTMSGIQLPPQILTFGCGSYTKWENLFCPTNFGKERKSIRIFWYYNQWKECYEKLKKSLGKSIRFEKGVSELSEDLPEINARYNDIIMLDNLMTEETYSLVVSQLFTQGRHRNASVILLLQNMFPKGNIIHISAEIPSTWLSFEVLAIENKSELLQNACLTRMECTL